MSRSGSNQDVTGGGSEDEGVIIWRRTLDYDGLLFGQYSWLLGCGVVDEFVEASLDFVYVSGHNENMESLRRKYRISLVSLAK